MRQRLERAGCTVAEAGGGEEAAQCLRETQAHFDVVLSDVQMPGPIGAELVGRLWESVLGCRWSLSRGTRTSAMWCQKSARWASRCSVNRRGSRSC